MAKIETDEDFLRSTIGEAKLALEQIIDEAQAHIFHVGMTNNYKRRRYGPPYSYIKLDGNEHSGYVSQMRVIYETPSREVCQNVEYELIEHARQLIGDYRSSSMILGNQRKGRAGRPAESGPYYVYVALGG